MTKVTSYVQQPICYGLLQQHVKHLWTDRACVTPVQVFDAWCLAVAGEMRPQAAALSICRQLLVNRLASVRLAITPGLLTHRGVSGLWTHGEPCVTAPACMRIYT